MILKTGKEYAMDSGENSSENPNFGLKKGWVDVESFNFGRILPRIENGVFI